MPLLTVQNLRTHYFTEAGVVKAVDGVSFTLDKGESIAIAGESGCGKSTIVMSLMRLIKGGKIVEGKITLNDESLLEIPMDQFRHLRGSKISIVTQAAMGGLNPVYTIGAQIVEAIRNHIDCSKNEAKTRTAELLKQVRVDPARAKSYPHELSGGMRQRAMIAMALACDPEIVICDEITTALDVVTQVQVLKLLVELQTRLNLSIIIISHDLSILGQTCSRIIIMYAGKIVEVGKTEEIFTKPRHPYTQKLLSSLMDIHSDCTIPESMPGKPPDLLNPPPGCRFQPRCAYAESICEREEPAIIEVAPEYYVACHMLEKINGKG